MEYIKYRLWNNETPEIVTYNLTLYEELGPEWVYFWRSTHRIHRVLSSFRFEAYRPQGIISTLQVAISSLPSHCSISTEKRQCRGPSGFGKLVAAAGSSVKLRN